MKILRTKLLLQETERRYAIVTSALKNISSSILSNAENSMARTNNFIMNPGKVINNRIANTIRHPVESVTEIGSFGVKKAIDSIGGGVVGITDFVPKTGIAKKTRKVVQNLLDNGRKYPSINRARKAEKYLKSNFAKNLEYNINNVASKVSSFGNMYGI